MRRFTDSIRRSVERKEWYVALVTALALPDVCGWLEYPKRKSQPRYVTWYRRWLEPKYTRYIGSEQQRHVFLCAEDCYALRCSLLHQGIDDIQKQKAREVVGNFHFISPPSSGGIIHINQKNGTLQLQVDLFCIDIANGVDEWDVQVAGNSKEIQDRKNESLLVVHDGDRGVKF